MSIASKIINLINKGNAKMGTSHNDLTSVVNNLIGGYQEASWIDLGIGQSFDVKTIAQQYGIDYTTLTEDDFLVQGTPSAHARLGAVSDTVWATTGSGAGDANIVKTYDSIAGILTCYLNVSTRYSNAGSSGSRGDVHGILLLAKR